MTSPAGRDRPGSPLHHVVIRGDGQIGLLLIHALGADLRMWEDFTALWDRPETLVALDLRNAGLSPRSDRPLTPGDHAADLDLVREACGLDKVVVVGCAIGSLTAASYAARHADRVAGLVMVNPALKTAPAAATMLAERAALVRRDGMAAILPGAVDRPFLEQPRDDRYARYLARFAVQDPHAYALSCEAVLDADITADLGRVRCPSLVVSGEHDVLLPPEIGRAVHALLPGSRFAIESGAAHFIPAQSPRAFRDRVAEFLDVDVLPALTPRRSA